MNTDTPTASVHFDEDDARRYAELQRFKHMGFGKLENSLAHRPGVTDPGALAASIGRKKYGAGKMAKAAAAGHAVHAETLRRLNTIRQQVGG